MDNFSFWVWVQTTIDVYGETYLAMVKDDNGMPTSFMPMHPTRVAVKRNPDTTKYECSSRPARYRHRVGAFPGQEDVVPFRLFNPKRIERGLSRLESLRSTLFSEDSSRNATAAMWGNSGRPEHCVVHGEEVGR
jgi:phage portal protein BeeE